MTAEPWDLVGEEAGAATDLINLVERRIYRPHSSDAAQALKHLSAHAGYEAPAQQMPTVNCEPRP